MASQDKKTSQNPMALINEQIAAHSFGNLYLFCGNEQYLAKQYLKKLLTEIRPDENSMNYTHYVSEKCNVDAIISDSVTMPFFDEFRVTLVEDSGYFTGSNDKLKDAFENIGEQNILIFYEMNVDKRTSTYKQLAKVGTVLEFETPDEDNMLKWIISQFAKDNLQIQRGVPEMLAEIAGENMLNLSNEIEKIRCYALEKGTVTLDDISLLCNSKIEDKIFEMCDAIGNHNSRVAIAKYNDLVALKVAPMYVISMISRHFRILSQLSFIQSGKDKKLPVKDKAALIGIKTFAVNKYLPQLKNQTTADLLKKSELCLSAEYAVKSGKLSDVHSVEKLILSLL